MKVAVMQPYFLPYIGYWQLIHSVDLFIIYDDVQFIRRGWVNRNRMLVDGSARYFSLSVAKGSRSDLINEKVITEEWFLKGRDSFLKTAESSYRQVKHRSLLDYFSDLVVCDDDKLSAFLERTIKSLSSSLGLTTEIISASQLDYDRGKKGADRILEVCRAVQAQDYVNMIGGKDLYDKAYFDSHGINLTFLEPGSSTYEQPGVKEFVPYLSILDTLLCNGFVETKAMLKNYKLMSGRVESNL